MKIQDVTKKLAKEFGTDSFFKPLSDLDRDYLDIDFVSFGSPLLDSKKAMIGLDQMTLITGWEGSGKSSLALIGTSQLQKKYPDKYVVYMDGENSVSNSYIDRFDINRDRMIRVPGNNLEDMLNQVEEFAKSEDVGMIIIDSVKSFFSSVVEEKDASDMTIGIEAKRFNARMPIIMGSCRYNNIALVVLNQLRENPGKPFGDPTVIPGGNWQKFLPSLHLNLSKRERLKDGNDTIGHVLDVRIKKSKYAPADEKDVFKLNFYYDYGFDVYHEYSQILIDRGVITKGGAWYTLPNGEKFQGLNSLAEYMENNQDYLNKLLIPTSDEEE